MSAWPTAALRGPDDRPGPLPAPGHLCGDVAGLGACADPACPPPFNKDRWTFAGSSEAFGAVLAQLASGFSLAGALLRVAYNSPPDGPLLLADGEQVAAAVPPPGVRLITLGGGMYALASGPVRQPAAWTDVSPGTCLLLDPCGVTTTHLHQPRREAIP